MRDLIKYGDSIELPKPLLTDDFSYPNGLVADRKGGTGWGDFQWIGNGMAVIVGELNRRSSDDPDVQSHRNFKNPAATKELFVSIDLRVGAAAVQQSDWWSLDFSVGVANPVLKVTKEQGSNEIQLKQGGTESSRISLEPDRKYRIRACYDLDQKVLSLWVDASPLAGGKIAPPPRIAYYDAKTGKSNADARREGVTGLDNANTITLSASRPGYFFDNLVIADRSNADGIDIVRNR
ncbi:MAG TPA: hypothetical protein VGQ36_16160 [Thermoanaerobaculia bacterium]|nr:hypothetical protein [Thermoanaerobaculia bacterium]